MQNISVVPENLNLEYQKIVDELLRGYEERTNNTGKNLETVCNEKSSTSHLLPQEAILINPVSISNCDGNSSQPNATFQTFNINAINGYVAVSNDKHSENAVTTCSVSKSIQTDEFTEDRINCGFVNVSNSGTIKSLNLRCFYCDAEYPISFWSNFSDHIIQHHGNLERVYNENHDLEIATNESTVVFDDVDSIYRAIEEEMPIMNCINLDDFEKNKMVDISSIHEEEQEHCYNSELMDTLSEHSDEPEAEEQYFCEENYDPNIDHSFIHSDLNQAVNEKPINEVHAPIDEINLAESPHEIIIDFLDHLKGFPNLWRDRKMDSEKYDKELLNLMNIMKVKWDLNLRVNDISKNLEEIKAWFKNMAKAKKNNMQDSVDYSFGEYYERYEDIFNFNNTNKQEPLTCDFCNRSDFNIIQLQTHKYSKHNVGELPYGCSKCDKRFVYIDKMLMHVKRHLRMVPKKENKKKVAVKAAQASPTLLLPTPSPPPPPSPLPSTPPPPTTESDFKCYECNKMFVHENEYKIHLDIHPNGDRAFACDICGKRYKNKFIRNTHEKKHTSTEYQCQLCELKLTSAFSFKVHMDWHEGKYEYVCEWCGQKFVCRKYWIEHCKFEHFGEGVCKICNREYKKRNILRKHLKNLHRPTFGTNEELSRRFRRNKVNPKKGVENLNLRKYEYVMDPITHTRRLKCPKCEKTFTQHKNVREHALKIHEYDVRNMQRGSKSEKRQQKIEKSKLQNNSKKPISIVNRKANVLNIKGEETNRECASTTSCDERGDDQSDYYDSESDNTVIGIDNLKSTKATVEVLFEKVFDETSENKIDFSFQITNGLLQGINSHQTSKKLIKQF